MKRFVFSFQYLLDAHKAREQAAEHELHTAIKDQDVLRKELASVAAVRAQQVEHLRQMTGTVNRVDYANYRRGIDQVQRDMLALEDQIERFEETIEACRETLRKEMTSRKVMENLREKEQAEWAASMQTEEQKQMDELAVGRWSRQVRKI